MRVVDYLIYILQDSEKRFGVKKLRVISYLLKKGTGVGNRKLNADVFKCQHYGRHKKELLVMLEEDLIFYEKTNKRNKSGGFEVVWYLNKKHPLNIIMNMDMRDIESVEIEK